ncbi:hypothetical protein ASG73_00115 [Janibacter sp. Soil728]|uniref:hypothetical protein n=1 Tax=Janibacter sp. Soil728 TaxID=1736393 RepID=UPI0006F27F2F|nr:hypothetical protein [Janibacter sp. Soil728]KRE38818.1 hypothetical protein ASG73_00115 [Janibacter sp. Soil728]
MNRPHVTATAALVVALTAGLTGCTTPFGSDDPSTSQTTTPTPASPSTPADSGRGRQLSEQEATAALPTRPTGAKNVAAQSAPEGRATDPAECLDILRAGPEGDALRQVRVAHAERTWSTQDPATSYSFEIDSYSRPVGPALLDRSGAAMSSCSTFSLTGEDSAGHFDLRVIAEPRTVPTIGEQNYGARLITFDQVDGKSVRVYMDYIVVRAGHNLVAVTSVHRDEDRGRDELETHAEEILQDLQDSA